MLRYSSFVTFTQPQFLKFLLPNERLIKNSYRRFSNVAQWKNIIILPCKRCWNSLKSSSYSTSIEEKDPVQQSVGKLLKFYSALKERGDMKEILQFQTKYPFCDELNKLSELEIEKRELFKMKEESDDSEICSMVDADLKQILEDVASLQLQLLSKVPSPCEDSAIDKITIEVNPGIGGQEAMLFALDLFSMYKNFCVYSGWAVEENFMKADEGGLKYGNLEVSGHSCYQRMKFEGGIHRVQRIPKTEKAGRIHTSTASVALLPQPSQVDVVIEDKDLAVETMRSSGAGGQHVNTTDSAVRIKHLPTGIVTECQTGKSQLRNKEIAIQKLRAKIYQNEVDQQFAKIYSQRKLQVGTKGRSEKIRTYNYLQDRITDHRIPITLYNVPSMLSGRELLERLINKLQEIDRKETLFDLADLSVKKKAK